MSRFARASLLIGIVAASFLFVSRDAQADDPNANAIAAGLQDFAGFGDTIGTVDELGQDLPLTGLSPGSADGLDLSNLFGDSFAPLGASFVDLDTLESDLEGLDDPNLGGIGIEVTFGCPTGDPGCATPVDVTPDNPASPTIITVTIPFEATRTVTPPLAFESDIVDLNGGGFSVTIALSTTITFELNTSLLTDPTDPSLAFSILGEPDMDMAIDASGAISALTTVIGFAEVDASGSADLDIDIELALNDPDDDGKIAIDELTSTALADLLAISFVDDSGTTAADIEVDFDTNLISTPTPAECDSGDACLVLSDPDITPAGGGLASPQFFLGDAEDFRNFTAEDALRALDRLVEFLSGLQAAGKLDVDLPFVNGGFSDVFPLEDTNSDGIPESIAERLQDAAEQLRQVDNPATPLNESEDPTFDDIVQMGSELASALGMGSLTPSYDATNRLVTFSLTLTGSDSTSVPLDLSGSLDVLSGIDITGGGSANLSGAYTLNLVFGLDLTEQPTEGPAGGVGSCEDDEDNDGDGFADAADPDNCQGLKTINQRAFLSVGSAPGSPELTARTGFAIPDFDAEARIGLLEVDITNANLRLGSGEPEDGAAPGTCNDGIENGGADGQDSADPDCTFVTLDFTDTGNGRLTIEELFNTIGGNEPAGASLAADLNADLDSTVPVSASLSGTPLGGGNILISGSFDGPLTGAQDFLNSIDIDASGLSAGDLLKFSPCTNGTDDDGDTKVNDGCPQMGAEAEVDQCADSVDDDGDTKVNDGCPQAGPGSESGSQCDNDTDDDGDGKVNDGCTQDGSPEVNECDDATDDDGDSKVNDGCPAESEPESSSDAMLDQIFTLLQALVDRLDLLEDEQVGSSLSDPLPLVGNSFEDIISFSDRLGTVVDDILQPEEDADEGECDNATDDDEDGTVNDGCPTVSGVPEAGDQCDEDEATAADSEDNDASTAAQNTDGKINDGCPPVNPSLQQIETQLENLLTTALEDLTNVDSDTTAVDLNTVDLELVLDSTDLKFLLDVNLDMEHNSTFNLDIGDIDPSLADLNIVGLESSGAISALVSADLQLDFGLNLDDFSFFVLGSTALTLEGRADAEEFTLDVNVGPLEASIGTNTPMSEHQCGGGAGNAVDEDGDGTADDGCPGGPAAVGPAESDQCADAEDDDEDGAFNDGCPSTGSVPETNGCGNQFDGDDDGKVNDGCPAAGGAVAESGGQCNNNTDDHATGSEVNDGCPQVGDEAESGEQCNNNTDDDSGDAGEDHTANGGIGFVNDGCFPGGVDNAEFSNQCADSDDQDSDAKPNDGCPADGGAEGANEPAVCDNNTNDDSHDDPEVNDGCPAVADKGRLHVGAKFNINATGADSAKITDFSSLTFTEGTGLTGLDTPPAQCQNLVSPGAKDACAVLPLYFEDKPIGSPPDHHISVAIADIKGSPETNCAGGDDDSDGVVDDGCFEFDPPDVSALSDLIANQLIDLLLMESGLGQFLEVLEQLLRGELLGFDLPLIGDQLDNAADFLERLRTNTFGTLTNEVNNANSGNNPLESLADAQAVQTEVQSIANAVGEAIDGDPSPELGLLLDTNGDGSVNESDFALQVLCGGGDCGIGPEEGAECLNNTSDDDDDGDGTIGSAGDKVNDGCPRVGDTDDADCDDAVDDDGAADANEDETANGGIGFVNDGCYPGGFSADAAKVDEITFRAKLGQSSSLLDQPVDFNSGIPGLGLEATASGNVTIDAEWALDIGFGVSKDFGVFVLTNDALGPPETDECGSEGTGDGDNDDAGDDAVVDDGCGANAVSGSAGEENECSDNYSDDDGDGRPNDGCPELLLAGDVSLPDEFQATLGFLLIKVVNGDPAETCASVGSGTVTPCLPADDSPDPDSSFNPKFVVDLTDPGATDDNRLSFAEMSTSLEFDESFEYEFSAVADVNLHIETSLAIDPDAAALPKLIGDLNIDWRWTPTATNDPDDLEDNVGTACADDPDNCFDIAINNLNVDAGTFLSQFLEPVLDDAQQFTKPLQPIIDVLNAPIPVLSDLSGEPVTLLTLIDEFGPSDNNLDMIIAIVKVIDFVNGINVPDGTANLTIPIGSFALDGDRLQSGPLGASAALEAFELPSQLQALTSLMDDFDGLLGDFSDSDVRNSNELRDDVGVTFPFLDEPSQLVLMLFGQDADLIVWEPPDLEAGFTLGTRLGPVWSVPPVFIDVSFTASIKGHLQIGYDTEGLRLVLFEGAGGWDLLKGLFLGDHKDGQEIPEITLRGEGRVGATVSVLIFEAGAFGGIGLTIEADLDDPNNDGKMKFQEVADILIATGNIFCLFEYSGSFDVFVGVFAEVDLFFWSQRWEKILARIVLLTFDIECDFNQPPDLARSDGTNLILNIGPDSDMRGSNSVGINTTAEEFTVTQEPNGSLTVDGFGFEENWCKPSDSGPGGAPPCGGWGKVIANASHDVADPDDDADSIAMLDGALGGETGAECDNSADDDDDGFVNDGCPGVNKVERADECNDAVDEAEDGAADKVNDGCPPQGDLVTVPFTVPADIIGGEGPDQLQGGTNGDYIDGGTEDDLIDGRSGDDNIQGGGGNDSIGGAAGNDYIFGDVAILGTPETGGDCDGDDDDGDNVPDDGCFNRSLGEAARCDVDLEPLGTGNDTVEAGLGDDIVCGQGGDDNLTGGISNAGAVGAAESGADCGNNVDDDDDGKIDDGCTDGGDKMHGGAGADTMNGADGNDFLFGDGGRDNINGDKGADTIHGGDESSPGDTIFGGPDADTINGDAGDDKIVGGSLLPGTPDVGDTLLAGDGGDDIILGDNAQFSSETEFILIDPNIGGGDTIDGGADDDTIRGQKGNDDIFGGTGGDNIEGNDGDDFIFGDAGAINNRATANVTVSESGFDGVDTMLGNTGADHMYGGGAGDFMYGDESAGSDTFGGDSDTDYMEGNSGDDTMRGGQQADEMHGDHADDTDTGGTPGSDTMFGDSGDDDMFGGPEEDTMRGGIGDDYMEGNGAADLMHGDANQDDMIGGTSASGEEDDESTPPGEGAARGDKMFGNASHDVMAGDNASITRPGGNDIDGSALRTVILHDLADGNDETNKAGNDIMEGNEANDDMYGGGEDDTMHGNAGDDYMEGNGGGDTMFGDAAQDDLVGGTSQGAGGKPDGVDIMHGDDGDSDQAAADGDAADVMAGDNASIDRVVDGSQWAVDQNTNDVIREITLFDLQLSGEPAVSSSVYAGDDMFGEGDHDEMFGGGGDDEMHGGDDFDYMEGNHQSDTMFGDGDQDDMIGGGSANDGVIDDNAVGDDLLDGSDTMFGDEGDDDAATGNDESDVMAGDNARILRPTDITGDWLIDDNSLAVIREIRLFDVELSGGSVGAGTAGGDIMYGEGDHDTMFGQGNADDTDDDSTPDGLVNEDPVDGNDNDGDGATDEDGGGDFMHGGQGNDYMEGNHGRDWMWGDADEDDMIGGGSANDGIVDFDRVGNGLLDGGDYMHGDDGDGNQAPADGDEGDVMTGDNARMLRDDPWTFDPNTDDIIRHVVLFDVDKTGAPAQVGTSGGDLMLGEGDHDEMFGQGGGDEMHGGDDFDYMEGNHGSDAMTGDAGQDDMTGGGSANDGVIDADRAGDDLLDGNDTMSGESDMTEGTDPDGDFADVMLGDNGVISRPTSSSLWIDNPFNEAVRRHVQLADVEMVDQPAQPLAESGTDHMWGNDADDIMYGQGREDEMHGGRGDDYMEGNAASDTMFGEQEGDDMLGGTGPTSSESQLHELSSTDRTSAIEGRTDISTRNRTVPFGTGTTGNLLPTANVPLGDEMYGNDGADVMLGDNGIIIRPLQSNLWTELDYALLADAVGDLDTRHPTGGASERITRTSEMIDDAVSPVAGSDLMFGGNGDDDMYGQLDDTGLADPAIGDEMYGEAGEDAMAGDNGVFVNFVIQPGDPRSRHIEPHEPFIEDDVFITGSLFREFHLSNVIGFEKTGTNDIGGDDRMRGGSAGDWMHGGAGNDIANGDEGNDHIFGDNGGDALWGGPHHDHLWGGFGGDFLDVHPRVDETDGSPDSCNPLDPPDPSAWYSFSFDSLGACDGNFNDIDFMYGGWGADALQANIGDNGPQVGDRLIDWVGVYNLFILCPGTYGEFVSTREFSPQMTDFIHAWTDGSGAYRPGPDNPDVSGFNELAFVFRPDLKSNKNPPYVDTPAHFICTP